VAWGQPRQKVHLNGKKLGMVAYTCHPSCIMKPEIGGSQYRLAWAKARPCLQNN
jgi:hypothetical protein